MGYYIQYQVYLFATAVMAFSVLEEKVHECCFVPRLQVIGRLTLLLYYFINIDDKRCTKQLVVRAKTIYKVILYLNATAIVTYNVISILLLYLLFYFSSSIMATIATDMKIIFFFFFF